MRERGVRVIVRVWLRVCVHVCVRVCLLRYVKKKDPVMNRVLRLLGEME